MDLPDTLSAEIFSKGQAEPPDDLLKFFCVLYTGTRNKERLLSIATLHYNSIIYIRGVCKVTEMGFCAM